MGLTKKNKKIVDDTASKLQCNSVKIEMSTKLGDEGQVECGRTTTLKTGWCKFCDSFGVIVDQFPRRGYGKQNYGMEWHLVSLKKG